MSLYARLRLAREAGIDVHPPYADLALAMGDQFIFNTEMERIHLIYDGTDWRILKTESVVGRRDLDPDEVTLL
jgi:hypothetical protein